MGIVDLFHMGQALAPGGGFRVAPVIESDQLIAVPSGISLNGVQTFLGHLLVAIEQHDNGEVKAECSRRVPLRCLPDLADALPFLGIPIL